MRMVVRIVNYLGVGHYAWAVMVPSEEFQLRRGFRVRTDGRRCRKRKGSGVAREEEEVGPCSSDEAWTRVTFTSHVKVLVLGYKRNRVSLGAVIELNLLATISPYQQTLRHFIMFNTTAANQAAAQVYGSASGWWDVQPFLSGQQSKSFHIEGNFGNTIE